jgi:hypothetical protein
MIALAGLVVFGLTALFGVLFEPSFTGFYLGLGLGAGAVLVIALIDTPPHYIASWGQGADGERRTARALRGLARAGWHVVHDLDTGRGNIDHVLVGPAGVFVLETKHLSGDASVRKGVLKICRSDDADDGYRDSRLAGLVMRRSAVVIRELQARGLEDFKVQPLVVLWTRFEQGSLLSGKVAWVRGDLLADVLEQRPHVLTPDQVERVSAALTALERRNMSAAAQAA